VTVEKYKSYITLHFTGNFLNSFASFIQPDPSKQRSENLHIYKAQPTSRRVLGVTETEIALLVTEGSMQR
jgi:hypothetical protein